MTPAQKAAQTRKANRATSMTPAAAFGLMIKTGSRYREATRDEILEAAGVYFAAEARGTKLTGPTGAVELIRKLCAGRAHESFCGVFLDTRHQVIKAERMFTGTIDGAAVYPREIVRRALALDAAAIILGHNHPSGDPDPSEADRTITVRIQKACALIDVRVLDHIVVSNTGHVSLAELGWL